MYKIIEKHTVHSNKYIPIIGGDFNAELGPGNVKVWADTLSTRVIKGDWLKSWLMLKLLLRSQYDVQEDSAETDVLRLSKKGKKNKLTTF